MFSQSLMMHVDRPAPRWFIDLHQEAQRLLDWNRQPLTLPAPVGRSNPDSIRPCFRLPVTPTLLFLSEDGNQSASQSAAAPPQVNQPIADGLRRVEGPALMTSPDESSGAAVAAADVHPSACLHVCVVGGI